MSSILGTKHSPNFLFDGTVALYVGRDSKRMEIHKKLLASISPELDKHVNNDMKEGIEGIILLPHEEEVVFTLFTKWVYTGDYAYEDDTPFLCVFSDKFNIPTLRHLAKSKFHAEVSPFEPNSTEDAAGLVLAIGYAYDNLPNSDPILKFLAHYASWKLELLRATPGFEELILARPEFLKALLATLKGLSTKPTATTSQMYATEDDWNRMALKALAARRARASQPK
ncbi:hypothetical protein C7212DRAFT_346694 [Tuber magnatum]|uniref:BTB domain-containing protein n=1 Tax=Tuber magnatum TaxID=42249 RepID=A0A317SJK9_9PEZI|nr:hypothetical protein C7212DRAFT_346694 [Tuber magnatum]